MIKLLENLIGIDECNRLENSIELAEDWVRRFKSRSSSEITLIPCIDDLIKLENYHPLINGRLLKGVIKPPFNELYSDEENKKHSSYSIFRVTGGKGLYLKGDIILTDIGGSTYTNIARDRELFIYTMDKNNYKVLDENLDKEEIYILNNLFDNLFNSFKLLDKYLDNDI